MASLSSARRWTLWALGLPLAFVGLRYAFSPFPFSRDHWRHPLAYRAGRIEARRDIARGTAVARDRVMPLSGAGVDSVLDIPLVKEWSGRSVDYADNAGYMDEIWAAARDGRLAASALGSRKRSARTALEDLIRAGDYPLRAGAPPVLSPSGRYRIDRVAVPDASDPTASGCLVRLVDREDGTSPRPRVLLELSDAEESCAAAFVDDERTIFLRAWDQLGVYDVARGIEFHHFDEHDLRLAVPTLFAGGDSGAVVRRPSGSLLPGWGVPTVRRSLAQE